MSQRRVLGKKTYFTPVGKLLDRLRWEEPCSYGSRGDNGLLETREASRPKAKAQE